MFVRAGARVTQAVPLAQVHPGLPEPSPVRIIAFPGTNGTPPMPLTRLLLLPDLIRPIPAMAQVWNGAVPDDSALCEAGPSAGQGPILSCGGPSAADLTGDKTGHIDPRNTPPGAREPSLVGCLFPTLGVPEAILGLDAVVAPLDYGLSGVLLGGCL
jgi:hypothetical protein